MQRMKMATLIAGLVVVGLALFLTLSTGDQGTEASVLPPPPQEGAAAADLAPGVHAWYLCADSKFKIPPAGPNDGLEKTGLRLINKLSAPHNLATTDPADVYCQRGAKSSPTPPAKATPPPTQTPPAVKSTGLKCSPITGGHNSNTQIRLKTQYNSGNVNVGLATDLCWSVAKPGAPDKNEAIYECYQFQPAFQANLKVALGNWPQLNVGGGAAVLLAKADTVCVPTVVTATTLKINNALPWGNQTSPHLVCYDLTQNSGTGPPAAQFGITTLGDKFAANVTPLNLSRACVEATQSQTTSSVTCADVWLAELQSPVANPKPVAPGAPPTSGVAVAISLTYSQHDLTDDTTHGVGATVNGGITGVIGGTLDFPITARCARVDKPVTLSIKDNPANPPDPVTLSVNEVLKNEPLVGMIVFWDSTNANQRGFYHVDTATKGSVTLTRIVNGACNGEPGTNQPAPGNLRTCTPVNKGLHSVGDPTGENCQAACFPQGISYPLAYSNSNIVDTAAISTFGKTGGVPRTDANQCPILVPDPGSPKSGSCYVKAETQTESSACGGSTGFQEGAQQNAWTRTDIITVTKSVNSDKVPSYGIAQLYNPTTPKNCANTAGTNRSTNITVVWSLDGGDDTTKYNSDWDKDGCLDWQEHSSPLPVYVNGPVITDVDLPYAGRDAQNPNDCDRNMGGIWGAEVTINAVSLTGGNVRVPGSYRHCRLSMDHNKNNNQLDAKILCYVDDPNVLVNTDEADGATCPDTFWCGDGFTGSSFPIGSAAPPPPYADIPTDAHAALSGSLNKTNDTWSLEGCIPDTREVQSPKSNTYIRFTDIGGRTGNGTVEVWTGLTSCAKPGGSPTQTGKANFVQHAPKDDGFNTGPGHTRDDAGNYDFDLDGCPDARELGDNRFNGGLRDPYNPWDRQDVNKDGFVNVPDDILETAANFGPIVGNFNHPANRGPRMIGANNWNKRPPDSAINVPDDILGTAAQFGHTCFN